MLLLPPTHDRLINRRTMLATSAAAASLAVLPTLAHGQASNPGATPGAAPATPVPGGTPPDPQMQAVLDALASFDAPPLESVTPEIGRELPSFKDAVVAILTEQGKPAQEPVGDIRHVLVPGLDNNQVLVRLYYPKDMGSGALPVTVYFHGGGFVIANLDTYEASFRAVANASGSIVAAVAYRLAPEHPLPAATNDAYAATQYFLSSAGAVGGDPQKVAVVGESAGGNLATVVSMIARDQGDPMPIHQGLIYPLVTFAPEGAAAESVTTYAQAKPLNAKQLDWFGQYALADPAQATEPTISPLLAADLSGLPPATVIGAEIDPLQSQGKVYADALAAAKVDTSYKLYTGVTHEFFGMGAVVDTAKQAVDDLAARLKDAFGS